MTVKGYKHKCTQTHRHRQTDRHTQRVREKKGGEGDTGRDGGREGERERIGKKTVV